MGVDLQPDHLLALARLQVGQAREGDREKIVIDDIGADEHIAAAHHLGESGAGLVVHRLAEQVDREIGKDPFFLVRIGARGQAEADIPLIIRIFPVDRRQRIRHQRRQPLRPVGPVAHHAILINAETHARRTGLRRRDIGQKAVEELLLLELYRRRIVRL